MVEISKQKLSFHSPRKGCLYCRQTVTIDFPVQVEGKYVGHARDVVEHGLYPFIKPGGVDAVLAGDAVYQQARVGLLRLTYSLYHQFEQGADDPETGQFDVQNIARTVNLL